MKVDHDRVLNGIRPALSNIFVRAESKGSWDSWDLVYLDRPSIIEWLDGAGPEPSTDAVKLQRARNTLLAVLGHDLER